jgi:predicted N-acetyltransferase YhbS
MGKIFPLSEKSSCFESTLKLIERSFEYKKPHSFAVDFAPLVDKSNHHNCFIYIDENDDVLAHIGVKERTISFQGSQFSVCLLGGIAVDEKHRGEGIFQTLLNDILAEKRSDTTLFLLWSNLEKLYNKFGFHLCGTQFELALERKATPFQRTLLKNLSLEEKNELKSLYKSSFSARYLTLERTEKDWKELEEILSADLYIRKKDGLMQDYYFMNKGQDLSDVIYEYGSKNDFKNYLGELAQYGKVWMGTNFLECENLQYQFFMAPGDLKLFANFVLSITGEKFAIRNINLMKQEVFFDFNDETLSLGIDEFLRGLFGPGIFEEIEVPFLFISGLDSI